MLFTEPSFLFAFLPVLLVLHAVAPARARNALLAAASLIFYAWGEPVFVAGLVVSIAANHAFARAIAGAPPDRIGRLTALGVASNLLFLGWFKYAGFALANLDSLAMAIGMGPLPAALVDVAPGLPIGISFFTFQAISLLVDLGRRDAPPPRSLLDTALYIAMFAQLIAGPIVRYADLALQLRERHVELADVAAGVRRFSLGLAKKLLLAEILALPADRIFALAEPGAASATPGLGLTAATAWLALLCFGLQIYLDFSAYSDMAIGLARLFGFRYRENFEHPYSARSVTEFWRRWHISLSSWFRDYLYIPLGGGRRPAPRVALNLTLVFLLCGLWHGAAWTFVLWGALHGFALGLERVLPIERLPSGRGPTGALRRALTLGFVFAAWIPFRCETLAGAGAMLGALVGLGDGDPRVLGFAHLVDPRLALVLVASLAACVPAPARWARQWLGRLDDRAGTPRGVAITAELAGLSLVLGACLLRIAAGGHEPFLYFRF